MSKKSCKAAESIKDALLRMAHVNGNFFLSSRLDILSLFM